jgi:hypothetical protein
MSGLKETVEQSQVIGASVGATDLGAMAIEKEVVMVGDADTESPSLRMSLRKMELSNFLTRSTRVATGLLQATDTAYFNLLGSTFDPFTLFLSNTYINAKVKEFSWFRADLEVIMTLTVPSNAYGLYNLQALCEGGNDINPNSKEVGGAYADNVWTSLQDVHALIDITKSTTVVLELPWVYAVDAYQINQQVGPWRLCLWPLQPIRNAMNTDVISGTYNIYVRFKEGFELGLPTFQSSKGKSLGRKVVETASELRTNKTVSKTAAALGGAAAMIGTAVPFMAPMAMAASAGLASIASIADYFGFTREAEPLEPMPVALRSINNLANVDGKDTSDVVALFSNNATTIDPTIGGGRSEDETSIASLYPRETIVDTFAWPLSDAAGVVLRGIPVTPFFNYNVLGVQYPSTAGYIGLPFNYWRGGMKFHLYVPSSMYHRGMLQVFWSPTAITIASDLTNVLFNHILDVTVDSDIEIEIPYAMPQMCLRNTGFLNPTAQATAYASSNVNGFLYFVVANQLQTVGATGDIQVFVTAKACPDMRFGVPCYSRPFLSDSTYASALPAGFIWQMQSKDDGGGEMKTVNLLGGDSAVDSYPVEDVLWGEVFGSVRALAQRMSFIFTYTTIAVPYGAYMPHFWPPPAPTLYAATPVIDVIPANSVITSTRPNWTWFSHYAAMFVGVRGSTRYKLLGMNPGHIVTALPILGLESAESHFPPNNVLAAKTAGGLQSSAQNFGPGCGFEVTLPYYDRYKFRWCRFAPAISDTSSDSRWDYLSVSALSSNAVTAGDVQLIYQAGGPDTTFIRFRRTPALILYA